MTRVTTYRSLLAGSAAIALMAAADQGGGSSQTQAEKDAAKLPPASTAEEVGADAPSAEKSVEERLAELEARTAAAEGRAVAAESAAEQAQAALAKFDQDGDGKPGGRRRNKAEVQPAHMAPAPSPSRGAVEILGDGLFSHLSNAENAKMGGSDADDRLAGLFKTNTDQIRAAAKAHPNLVLDGANVRLAGD